MKYHEEDRRAQNEEGVQGFVQTINDLRNSSEQNQRE